MQLRKILIMGGLAALGALSSIASAQAPNGPFYGGEVKALYGAPWRGPLQEDGDLPRFLRYAKNPKGDEYVELPEGYVEPPIPEAPESPEVQAGLSPQASIPRVVDVEGMSSSEWTPPDTEMAGGPSVAVFAINDNIRITDRDGVTLSEFDINTYTNTNFGWDTALNIFDPRVIWNPWIGRFVVCWDRTNDAGTENFLVVMVSATSNPHTGGWWTYVLDTEDNNTHWMDYPHIGCTRDAISFTGRMFPWGAGSSYDKVGFIEQDDAAIGGNINWWYWTNPQSAGGSDVNTVPATMKSAPLDGANSVQYVIGAKTFSTNTLGIHRISCPPGLDTAPTWLGSDTINVGTYAPPPGLSQNGDIDLENVAPRIMNFEYLQGDLFCAHAVGVTVGGVFRSAHRAYKISNAAGWPVTWNDVWSNASFDYGYPSIAINDEKYAFLTFSFSGDTGNVAPSVNYAHRSATDASWDGSYYVKQGTGTYSVLVNGRNRWGDYFGTSVDQFDNNGFWAYGMYTAAADDWSSWVGRYSLKPAAIVTPDPKSVETTDTVALTATVTRSDTAAVISGKSVTFEVNAVTVGSATSNGSGVATINYTAPLVAPTAYTIRCETFEDTTYRGDVGTSTLTITKHSPSLIIFARTRQFAEDVELRALLRRSTDLVGISGQTITFLIAGINVGTANTDANGDAFLTNTTNYAPNILTTQANYSGNTFYNGATDSSTYTINPANTTLTMPNKSGAIGQSVNLEATLTRNHDGVQLSSRTVSFTVGGVAVGSDVTDGTGLASLAWVVTSGALGGVSYTSAFAGDSLYNASNASGTFTRSSNTVIAVTNVSGQRLQNVNLVANLKSTPDNVNLNGQTLSFSINGTGVGSAVTNASGNATLAYVINAALPVGANTIGVTFAASGNYNNSTGTGTLTVNKWNSTLTESDVSGTSGQTINLTANLKRSIDNANVSGKTVSFTVAAVNVGTATTNASGNAVRSYVVAVGGLGNVALGASFAGDADYNASNAAAILTRLGKTLGGTVVLNDWTAAVTGIVCNVQVYTMAGTPIESFNVSLNSAGQWTRTNIISPTGNNRVMIKTWHWLTRGVTANLSVSGNTALSHSLINGDVDGDDEVGPGDFGLLAAAFLSVSGDPNWNPNADLDGDGEVGPGDFSILANNFLLSGDTP